MKLRDDHISMRSEEFDLRLAVFHAIRDPKRCYTLREISEFVGVSYQAIYYIEQQALKKVRKALEPVIERNSLRRPGGHRVYRCQEVPE